MMLDVGEPRGRRSRRAMMYQFRLPDGAAGVGQIEFAVTADVNDDVSTGQGEPARSATITEGSTLAPIPTSRSPTWPSPPRPGSSRGIT